ncbi:MAG: GvpL/GvpF family gas vesicle protein [Cyanobacteria bacterium J06632_22]
MPLSTALTATTGWALNDLSGTFQTIMTTGLYLYGIFPQPGPATDDLVGLDKQPVRSHVMSDFTILYSEAQKPKYLTSRRNLLSHERVLEAAMAAGHRTLLPLQFGLVIPTWDAVKDDLVEPYQDSLNSLLHKLDGQREVSIKIMWDQAAELERMMAQNPNLKAERDRLQGKQLNMEEVIQIGQAIETAMGEWCDRIINDFQSTLGQLAVEVAENDTLTADMIYNAAYLIPWEAEAQFSAAIEALDATYDDRLRIRYNNFTAPFNFAQLERN